MSTLREEAVVAGGMDPLIAGFFGFLAGVLWMFIWFTALEFVTGIEGVMTRVLIGE